MSDTITLKFGVRDDWISGMDAVLEVMEKAKRKAPQHRNPCRGAILLSFANFNT